MTCPYFPSFPTSGRTAGLGGSPTLAARSRAALPLCRPLLPRFAPAEGGRPETPDQLGSNWSPRPSRGRGVGLFFDDLRMKDEKVTVFR